MKSNKYFWFFTDPGAVFGLSSTGDRSSIIIFSFSNLLPLRPRIISPFFLLQSIPHSIITTTFQSVPPSFHLPTFPSSFSFFFSIACSCVTPVTSNWDSTEGNRALDEPPPGACLCARSCFSRVSTHAVGPHARIRARSRTYGLVSAIWI